MTDESVPLKPKSSPHAIFLKGALIIAAALGLLFLLLNTHQPGYGGMAVGTPFPPIKVAGWLKGKAPTKAELQGKVLLIDAWASWCGPCRKKAPELVRLYEKFHGQGVEFIGLSNEPAESIPNMERYLEYTEIPWKNGYGADETLAALGATYIPMVWIVDRNGQIVWNEASSISLEEGIQRAVSVN